MGNESFRATLDDEQTSEYTFVGRQNEINEIKETLKGSVVVQVFGMTKIGKSRVLKQLLKELHETRTCFYHDFSDDLLYTDEDVIDLIQNLIETFDEMFDVSRRNSKQPNDVISAIKLFKTTLKACTKQLNSAVLMLDNVEKVFTWKSAKDGILSFLKEISLVDLRPLRIIFTTSEKVSLTHRHFGEVEIGRMEDEHIDEIIRGIVKIKGVTQDGFDYAKTILGKQNEIYMRVIAKQCEGLPLAAYMVAQELTADEGMQEPADLVQILFNKRVKSLSLEYYPPEDRLDLYKRNIEKVIDDLDIYFFQTLNKNLDASNRQSIEQLKIEFTKDNDKAGIDITSCFKLLTQPCLIKFLGKTRQLDMHVIFRECILEMTGSDRLDDEVFRSLLTGNAKRYGLALTDTELDNPKLLEEYVLSLSEVSEDKSNANEPWATSDDLERGRDTGSHSVGQSGSKVVQEFTLPYSPADLLPKTGVQTDTNSTKMVCDTCYRIKRPLHQTSSDIGPEVVSNNLNIDPNNYNFCSCNHKMAESKYSKSNEDNSAHTESESGVPSALDGTIFSGAFNDQKLAELKCKESIAAKTTNANAEKESDGSSALDETISSRAIDDQKMVELKYEESFPGKTTNAIADKEIGGSSALDRTISSRILDDQKLAELKCEESIAGNITTAYAESETGTSSNLEGTSSSGALDDQKMAELKCEESIADKTTKAFTEKESDVSSALTGTITDADSANNQKMGKLKCAESIEENTWYSESESVVTSTIDLATSSDDQTMVKMKYSGSIENKTENTDIESIAFSTVNGTIENRRLSQSEYVGLVENGTTFPSFGETTQHAMTYSVNRQTSGTPFAQNDLSRTTYNRDLAFNITYNRVESLENNEAQEG